MIMTTTVVYLHIINTHWRLFDLPMNENVTSDDLHTIHDHTNECFMANVDWHQMNDNSSSWPVNILYQLEVISPLFSMTENVTPDDLHDHKRNVSLIYVKWHPVVCQQFRSIWSYLTSLWQKEWPPRPQKNNISLTMQSDISIER